MGLTETGYWGERDRTAFGLAVDQWGHTQQQAADAIAAISDRSATQSQVSKWVSGRIERPHPATIKAIREYVAEAPGAPGTAPDDPASVYEAAFQALDDEELLTPRQARFVDAAIERHATGPPMTPDDRATWLDTAALLKLTPQARG